MKKVLRPFFVLSLMTLFVVSHAQPAGGGLTSACQVSDVLVQNIRVTDTNPNDGKCTALFNVAFTLDANNGNKFIFIQTYIETATRNGAAVANPHPYPNYFDCQNGVSNQKRPPMKSQAGNPLLNIAIDNSGAMPAFTNYKPDPTLNTVGATQSSTITTFALTNDKTRYLLSDIEVVLPYECSSNTQYTFVTDVFATNAAQANTLNCVTCGIKTPLSNFIIGGNTNCNTVNATLTNTTNTSMQVTYSLYSDRNDNGILTTQVNGGNDVLIRTGTVTVAANSTVTINETLTGANIGHDVFVLINLGGAQRAQLLPSIECGPLPVTFKSFNAKRIAGDKVSLTWETAMESNNKGFMVQRNTGGGWIDVSMVMSKANGGNSNAVLTYDFTDNNMEKGLTQYRILQVDLDGRAKASEIRSVRGEAQQNSVMIYPNPSAEGGVNVLFAEGRGARNVMISDIGGRLIKQYRNVTSSTMRIDNLNPGMYTIRIVSQVDGTQSNEKLVINK